jgi:CRP-like cAMP-binding protein
MQPPNELCAACRLRRLSAFTPNTPEQIAFIQEHKVGEQVFAAGGTILAEGQSTDRLFTLLIGWAFRHKTLPDGRRQILNFLLPGDLIGL